MDKYEWELPKDHALTHCKCFHSAELSFWCSENIKCENIITVLSTNEVFYLLPSSAQTLPRDVVFSKQNVQVKHEN